MKKKEVLDRFEELTVTVTKKLFDEIVSLSDTEFYFKDYYICRQDNGLYSICTRNTYSVLYKDIFLFSAAIGIADNLNKSNDILIDKLFRYDNQYSVLYQKMRSYSNSKKWDLYENSRIDANYILERIHDDIFQ